MDRCRHQPLRVTRLVRRGEVTPNAVPPLLLLLPRLELEGEDVGSLDLYLLHPKRAILPHQKKNSPAIIGPRCRRVDLISKSCPRGELRILQLHLLDTGDADIGVVKRPRRQQEPSAPAVSNIVGGDGDAPVARWLLPPPYPPSEVSTIP